MTVPAGAKQAGEAASGVQARWAWVEATVWTDRMLTALETGVKGGVWFSLIDKVYDSRNLFGAWTKVARNDGCAGVDRVTVQQYEPHVEAHLRGLSEQLRSGEYRPGLIRRVEIPKPGSNEKRRLGIPTVRDRIVQGALRHVLEPIFERDFSEHSYGFRPGKGCKDALREVDKLLRSGYGYVVDADLKRYFDSIPHEKLMERIGRKVADGRVLKLIEAFLKAGVMEGLEEWTPTEGSPQGAVVSPLLSNIYLDELDQLMVRRGLRMVRYADDFVILCQSQAEAREALEQVRRWCEESDLTLHPQKTRVVDARREPFEFLGYRFEKGRRWPRAKSLAKFREAIRQKTARTQGWGLGRIIAAVNPTMRGWFEYFKHSHRTVFESLDGWVRMRLRSILRKRKGKRGRGRGSDHQEWPNAFFAKHGLYSLNTAYSLASQSVVR